MGDSSAEAIEFAWRVHNAQEGWTARVDAKAALFLTLESGIVAALVAAQLSGHLLTDLPGWRMGLVIAGFFLSAVAAFIAVLAAMPFLGRARQHRAEHRQHLIYFGHLRHWNKSDLEKRLSGLSRKDQLNQLAQQLVEMSTRAWAKHVMLKLAMLSGICGGLLVGGVLLIAR